MKLFLEKHQHVVSIPQGSSDHANQNENETKIAPSSHDVTIFTLEACANEVSDDLRFCILEHSPAQRVFQPVLVFQAGGQAGR